MKKYAIAPELKKYCLNIPFSPLLLRVADPALRLMFPLVPIEKGVRHRKEYITNQRRKMRVDIFECENCNDKTPVLFYIHGGGFGYFASPMHKMIAAAYAKGASCRVVCPDYRLLPKYPYPFAKNDCLEAYRQTLKKYPEALVAVGGDSAGGALAIHVTNETEKPPCFQLLVYPVCGSEKSTASMEKYTDTPFWNAVNNKKMWQMYSGEKSFGEVSPMNVPLREELPPTYIELAEFDCLHDEGLLYAEKLKNAGASVTLNDTKGTVHGYDIATKTNIVKKNLSLRIEALKAAFSTAAAVEKSGKTVYNR